MISFVIQFRLCHRPDEYRQASYVCRSGDDQYALKSADEYGKENDVAPVKEPSGTAKFCPLAMNEAEVPIGVCAAGQDLQQGGDLWPVANYRLKNLTAALSGGASKSGACTKLAVITMAGQEKKKNVHACPLK